MVTKPSLDKPYVVFAREHRTHQLKQQALAKQERLEAEAQKAATAK